MRLEALPPRCRARYLFGVVPAARGGGAYADVFSWPSASRILQASSVSKIVSRASRRAGIRDHFITMYPKHSCEPAWLSGLDGSLARRPRALVGNASSSPSYYTGRSLRERTRPDWMGCTDSRRRPTRSWAFISMTRRLRCRERCRRMVVRQPLRPRGVRSCLSHACPPDGVLLLTGDGGSGRHTLLARSTDDPGPFPIGMIVGIGMAPFSDSLCSRTCS